MKVSGKCESEPPSEPTTVAQLHSQKAAAQPPHPHHPSIRHLHVEVPACDPSWFRVCSVLPEAEVMERRGARGRDGGDADATEALLSTLCVDGGATLHIRVTLAER